jgi:hypothetical protein
MSHLGKYLVIKIKEAATALEALGDETAEMQRTDTRRRPEFFQTLQSLFLVRRTK